MGQATNGKAERVWVRLPCFYTQEGKKVRLWTETR